MKETLGNKIKKLRLEKGMTQDELAKLLGYSSRSTINKIESDINTISYEKIKKLVEIFNIDASELVEDESYDNPSEELLDFIYQSPVAYNAIETIKRYLNKEGFIELHESEEFKVEPNKNYYVTRNGTSIIAFKVPSLVTSYGFNIVASHSDSPTYKIKPNTKQDTISPRAT